MTRFLYVLLAISILMMSFVFIAPKPVIAAEETPPVGIDSIPLGCVCIVYPLVYDCCFDAYWNTQLRRIECDGFWQYYYWLPYGCDPWNPRW